MNKLPIELLSLIIIQSEYNVNILLTCKTINKMMKYLDNDTKELICIEHNINCINSTYLNVRGIDMFKYAWVARAEGNIRHKTIIKKFKLHNRIYINDTHYIKKNKDISIVEQIILLSYFEVINKYNIKQYCRNNIRWLLKNIYRLICKGSIHSHKYAYDWYGNVYCPYKNVEELKLNVSGKHKYRFTVNRDKYETRQLSYKIINLIIDIINRFFYYMQRPKCYKLSHVDNYKYCKNCDLWYENNCLCKNYLNDVNDVKYNDINTQLRNDSVIMTAHFVELDL